VLDPLVDGDLETAARDVTDVEPRIGEQPVELCLGQRAHVRRVAQALHAVVQRRASGIVAAEHVRDHEAAAAPRRARGRERCRSRRIRSRARRGPRTAA
jgi:hypothetical protein